MEIFIRQDGHEMGPFTSDEVEELAVAGKIAPHDLLCNDSDGNWYRAETIRNLFPISRTGRTLIVVIRWIVFFPVALLASFVVFYVSRTVNQLTVPDSASFVNQLFIHSTVSAFAGITLVYVSAFVAPHHKKWVAAAIAVLTIFLSGALSLASLLGHNYWAIFNHVFLDFGVVMMAYQIFTGKTQLDDSERE